MPELLALEKLLRENLRRYHLEQGVKAKQSVSLWERVAGETVAEATHADAIRDGTLFVFTRSSAWSQELSLLRDALIRRLNEELGQEVVKDIRFQVRRFRREKAQEQSLPPRKKAPPLSAEEKSAVKALTQSLEAPVADRLTSVVSRHMQNTRDSRKCPGCGAPLHEGQDLCPFCE